jgi:LPS sulfotransferase NodH
MSNRFVIFSMGRTGSTLLANLLNSHPQIACDGEIFTPSRWPRKLRPIARFWQRHPFPYLAYRRVRTFLRNHKTIYGFKLHTKPDGSQLSDPGGFLHAAVQGGWKIIHLQRRFLFDQVISGTVAWQTGRYFGNQSKDEPHVVVTISPTTFRLSLQKSHRANEFNRTILADLPHLALTYEDELSDPAVWGTTVANICNYLEVPTTPYVRSKVVKPWHRPYSEIVTNYAELLSLYQEWSADARRLA